MRAWVGLWLWTGLGACSGPFLGFAEWTSIPATSAPHIGSGGKHWAYVRPHKLGWKLATLGNIPDEEFVAPRCGDIDSEIRAGRVGALEIFGSPTAFDSVGTVPVVFPPFNPGQPEMTMVIQDRVFVSGHAELTVAEGDYVEGQLEGVDTDGVSTVLAVFHGPICD